MPSIIIFILILCGCGQATAQLEFPKNSLRKTRVQPSRQAARIGSAVQWRNDWNSAGLESQKTGKPIFWYVPTLQGSFMDRVDSIDRYMLAGPFSWPDIIVLLNQHTIPLKARPTPDQQLHFDLRPYQFIEPGFLILDSDRKTLLKLDRLTTLHPQWLQHWIQSATTGHQQADNAIPNQANFSPDDRSPALERAWQQFRNGDYESIDFVPDETFLREDRDQASEAWLLSGMIDFRRGNHKSARQKWKQASEIQPDHPLAWKAAAETEGFGPFVRGFEIHRNLPDSLYGNKAPKFGTMAPMNAWNANDLWRRSTEFLLGMQADDGGFTDSDYDFGGTDSLSNVHVAVTSLAGMALLDSKRHVVDDAKLTRRIDTAITRAAEFVQHETNINFDDRDELVWACAYRVRFLAKLSRNNARYRTELPHFVQQLESLQSPSGSWFHEYNNPFVTATALLALAKASQAGINTNRMVVERGTRSLMRDRRANGAFPYMSQPDPNSNVQNLVSLEESAGRMPLCELALWTYRRSSDENLLKSVQRSIEKNQILTSVLKYDDHTSNYGYGGFFFWFDVQGRSEAIAAIRDDEKRQQLQQQHHNWILQFAEIDGCFVDSHELGRVYGTAMALLSLAAGEKTE